MRTTTILSAMFLAAMCSLTACSPNKAATEKCKDSKSSNECINCCHANGAAGYEWVGAGSCKCLN